MHKGVKGTHVCIMMMMFLAIITKLQKRSCRATEAILLM
jgi:hypothetical protein